MIDRVIDCLCWFVIGFLIAALLAYNYGPQLIP